MNIPNTESFSSGTKYSQQHYYVSKQWTQLSFIIQEVNRYILVVLGDCRFWLYKVTLFLCCSEHACPYTYLHLRPLQCDCRPAISHYATLRQSWVHGSSQWIINSDCQSSGLLEECTLFTSFSFILLSAYQGTLTFFWSIFFLMLGHLMA